MATNEQEPELVPGSIIGYRIWRIATDPQTTQKEKTGSVVLAPYTSGKGYWRTRKQTARCYATLPLAYAYSSGRNLKECDHVSPGPECTCGIYARTSWWDLWDLIVRVLPLKTNIVFGEIKATGLVIRGERGFRAQYGEIQCIAPLFDADSKTLPLLYELAELYDVPLLKSYSAFTRCANTQPPKDYDPEIAALIAIQESFSAYGYDLETLKTATEAIKRIFIDVRKSFTSLYEQLVEWNRIFLDASVQPRNLPMPPRPSPWVPPMQAKSSSYWYSTINSNHPLYVPATSDELDKIRKQLLSGGGA
ncbi:MAG TPA: hypothetical protein V6C65_05980 [Allocoleopsis sp.]